MTVRLVRAIVQLDLVVDDGTTLTPVQIQPITVPGAEWPLDLEKVLATVARELGIEPEPDGPLSNGTKPVQSAPARRSTGKSPAP